jgi:DNA-binding response OmpR family regulator
MKKILIIEDDQFLMDIYATRLRQEGFEVEEAINGEIALAKLKESPPDLILLDIILPMREGFEILKEIKSDERLKNLPVIIISNLSQREEIKKALSLGAVKYLVKSDYTPSQIVKEIKKILKL